CLVCVGKCWSGRGKWWVVVEWQEKRGKWGCRELAGKMVKGE
nr:hypothetical protein [Tanacetum cinerariifolium]